MLLLMLNIANLSRNGLIVINSGTGDITSYVNGGEVDLAELKGRISSKPSAHAVSIDTRYSTLVDYVIRFKRGHSKNESRKMFQKLLL